MDGWLFSIPKISEHKDLAWELITTILEPKILAPYLAAHADNLTQYQSVKVIIQEQQMLQFRTITS
jgi:hypothetical protein